MAKITLIGAGSVVFSKTLICDILQYPALSDSTICLMDIDPQRLAVAEKLTKRVIAQLGVKARVEATTDLRKACTGAKFGITAIQVGGYKPSTVVDFEIPAKYGVQQTIADTLGVGGVFRALRSIPALVNVARMLQEVGAENPLLLNYTNPMAMNMWAIDRLTGIDSVGLCHSVQGTSHQLATYCGLNIKDISYRVAGINHMAFFLKFEYKGKDAYPILFRALESPAVVAADRVRFEMMRRLGYFVTESSEHQSEYVPYFIHHGEKVIQEFGVPINEYIRRCETMTGRWEKVEQELLDESKPVEINRSVEYGSTIIHSIVSGELSVVYGNVPNHGLITNLTQGCSVEVPCLVDKQGLQPTYIGALPPQLAAICHTNLNVQELTVEAAVTGQREYIYQAVMMDPHTSTVLTLDKIWAMCDELIEAHQKDGYLGEFKPVVRNTGKPLSAVARVFLSLEPVGVPFLKEGSRKAEFKLVAENETQ
jgi:alpha-galactosidase